MTSTAEDYQRRADEALHLARTADTPEARAAFRRIAETWLTLAEDALKDRPAKAGDKP